MEAINAYAPDCRRKTREFSADIRRPLQGNKWVAIDGSACRTVDEFVEWIKTPMGRQVNPSLHSQHQAERIQLKGGTGLLTSALPHCRK